MGLSVLSYFDEIILEKLTICFLIKLNYFYLGVFFRTQKDFNTYMPLIRNGPRYREW